MLTDERLEQIKNIIHTELNDSLELQRTSDDLPVDGIEFEFIDQLDREQALEDFKDILHDKDKNLDIEYIEIDDGVFRCAVYDINDKPKENYNSDEE